MRSGIDQRRQVDVEDADIDEQRDEEEGETASHEMTDDLQPRQRQVAQHLFPKVVAYQCQAEQIRVDANILDTAQSTTK